MFIQKSIFLWWVCSWTHLYFQRVNKLIRRIYGVSSRGLKTGFVACNIFREKDNYSLSRRWSREFLKQYKINYTLITRTTRNAVFCYHSIEFLHPFKIYFTIGQIEGQIIRQTCSASISQSISVEGEWKLIKIKKYPLTRMFHFNVPHFD